MADDDEWTGSMKKPWLNPPMKHDLGTTRGSWKYAMGIIVVAIVAVVAVLALVNTDRLSDGWAYAVLPIAIVAAAASRVLTIFKGSAEDRSNGPDDV